MPQSILEVKDVSLTFPIEGDGGYQVIGSVSFNAMNNEFLSIIGPSGCGKSTLIRIILGLQAPTRGRIVYEGKAVREPMDGMALVFQNFALIPWKTALDNVKLALANKDMSEEEKDKKAKDALEKVKLGGFETAYPPELSGGQKQRVGIARALASDPSLLLMDEPFSSLDELTAEELREETYSLLKNKTTLPRSVIMVSHNVEEVIELSDRIIVLSKPPSHIVDVVEVKLKYPRDRRSDAFDKIAQRLYKGLYTAEE